MTHKKKSAILSLRSGHFSLTLTTDGRKNMVKLSPILEPISKKWIRVQGKARFGEKAEHTRKYVSPAYGGKPSRNTAMSTQTLF